MLKILNAMSIRSKVSYFNKHMQPPPHMLFETLNGQIGMVYGPIESRHNNTYIEAYVYYYYTEKGIVGGCDQVHHVNYIREGVGECSLKH